MSDFDTTVRALRRWTANHDPHVGAAVELLIEHETWIRRADFQRACVERNAREAWINWRKAREFVDEPDRFRPRLPAQPVSRLVRQDLGDLQPILLKDPGSPEMSRRGIGRYAVLQRDPARGPTAGWIVFDTHRQRQKGIRAYRGRGGFGRAARRADRLNRRAAR